MNNFTYKLFEKAKKRNDICTMENIYIENPKDSVIKFEYAKMLIKVRKFLKAKILLEELLEDLHLKKKIKGEVLLELGKIEFAFGNIDKARHCFEESLVKILDAYTMFELGKLELKQGCTEKAKRCFEKAISIKEDLYAMYELGKIYLLEKNGDKARQYFEYILTKREDFRTLVVLGKLEANDGNISKAKDYLERALKIKNDREVLEILAKLEQNKEKIREYLKESLKIKYNPFTILELGKVEFSLGNNDLARQYFESILNGETLICALMELGNLEYAEGNVTQSKKYFEMAFKDGENDFARTKLIILNIKTGNLDEALSHFLDMKKRKVRTDLKIELYLMEKLNIFFEKQINFWNNYNNSQLVEYDEFLAIDHIIANHEFQFSPNIDIYRLFQEIKGQLTPENKVGKLVFNDIYDIPFENIGDNANVLRVVTLPNTTKILTMYPLYDKRLLSVEHQLKL